MKIDNLNFLKTFYYVALEGNMTKMAEKYYTSQPSVSRAIKQLEDEYGVTLFYRNLNGVTLTEKGKILFKNVEQIFNILNLAETEMAATDDFEKGKLYIGVPSQIGGLQLFSEISKFHKSYPKIEIQIVSKTTTQLLNLLEKHELDFIIDTAPIKNTTKNIVIKSLCEYQNCFFVSNQFANQKLKNINSLKELENLPIILPIMNTANRDALNNVFQTYDLHLENVLNIHTSEMIISAVKKGVGIGYTLKDLILDDEKNGDIFVLNIKEPLPTTEVCLVYDQTHLSKIPHFFLTNYLKVCV